MQDRYAFDAGDFVELGLLRALIAGTGLRLGVNWYLVPDEAHTVDGKHVAYLRSDHPRYRVLAGCDPTLMGLFSTVDLMQRSVAALEACGALPSGSLTYDERLRPSMRADARRTWHADALRRLAGADVVFVDPDNCLTAKPRGSRSHKYVLPTRARRLLGARSEPGRVSPCRSNAWRRRELGSASTRRTVGGHGRSGVRSRRHEARQRPFLPRCSRFVASAGDRGRTGYLREELGHLR